MLTIKDLDEFDIRSVQFDLSVSPYSHKNVYMIEVADEFTGRDGETRIKFNVSIDKNTTIEKMDK
jgi:hypothetical protein